VIFNIISIKTIVTIDKSNYYAINFLLELSPEILTFVVKEFIMPAVRTKKHLGQHFLNDKRIALRVVESLVATNSKSVIEVGPGMGVLTTELYNKFGERFFAVEIDEESINYLKEVSPYLSTTLIHGDFLNINIGEKFKSPIAIIGNLPYNISSQIFFKVLENRDQINEVVCMIQKEVAQRISEKPGTKTYGILSVLLQAYFDIKYLFTVNEGVFSPPPKVKSAVIRLERNQTKSLDCDEKLFVRVVKAGFNQRRKTLRNSLRAVFPDFEPSPKFSQQRPEQLSVAEFVELTNEVSKSILV